MSSIPFFFPFHEDVYWRTNYLRSTLSRDNRGSQKILTFIKGLFSSLYLHFVFFILIGFPLSSSSVHLLPFFFHVVKKNKNKNGVISLHHSNISTTVRSTHQIMEEKEEKGKGMCWITYLGSLFQWRSLTQLPNETPESITDCSGIIIVITQVQLFYKWENSGKMLVSVMVKAMIRFSRATGGEMQQVYLYSIS